MVSYKGPGPYLLLQLMNHHEVVMMKPGIGRGGGDDSETPFCIGPRQRPENEKKFSGRIFLHRIEFFEGLSHESLPEILIFEGQNRRRDHL
jgi:hypothetical protein